MKIAYVKDGNVVAETFTLDIEVGFPHVVIDREILEPIESWYIEDGEIKIDQQKLIEFSRKTMPRLTPIEFDLKLAEFQLYDDVQNLIANNLQLKIAYTRATFFSRNEQVDAMWQETQNN